MLNKIHIPISFKLVIVTVLMMLAVSVRVGYVTISRLKELATQNTTNATLSNMLAYKKNVDNLMSTEIEKVRTVTNLLLQDFTSEEERKRALDLVFYNDKDLVNIEIYQLKDGKIQLYRRETNEAFLKGYSQNKSYIEKLRQHLPFPVGEIFTGKLEVRNSSQSEGVPLMTLGVPFPDDLNQVHHIAIADLRLDLLKDALPVNGETVISLTDSIGNLIAHPDDQLVLSAASLIKSPLYIESQRNLQDYKYKQIDFIDDNVAYTGSYYPTPYGVTILAQTRQDIIFEPAKVATTESLITLGYFLSGALFFIFVFSLTLTNPLERLHEATLEVAGGNFEVRSNVRTNDEVGELAVAFDGMIDGLKERDKVKNILNKFHGSTITADLLQSDLNLGGSRKQVTVFFSDIRDFTKFSEGHTPEEVVEMLNEYFQIMVSIVTANHGVVDKFVGDALMAIWGAPKTTGTDSFFAVKAALEMRSALAQLNTKRLSRGQTAIKIGMGIHSGPAISGTIGSTERMEYTVIGDTVNMASRIESSTKAFGTDLLVSATTSQELSKNYGFDFAGAAEVKGKSEAIKMFKVKGYLGANGELNEIKTPYSEYEAGHVDKVKVA